MPFKVDPVTSQPKQCEAINSTAQNQILTDFSCLSNVDNFTISQTQKRGDGCCAIKHLFHIEDSRGTNVLKGEVEIDCSQCHEGDIVLLELKTQVELVRIRKHQTWATLCGGSSIEVISPDGNLIGSAEEKWNFCTLKFLLKNGQGEHALWIEGNPTPWCESSHTYRIMSADRSSQVGQAEKGIMYLGSEFETSLQIDIEFKLKMVIISTIVYMDFLYFKSHKNHKPYRNRRGRR